MKTHFLVLGANGSIGYAVTKALLSREIETTILVRDAARATKLFGIDPHLRVVMGDANDPELLRQLAMGKSHIFHGLNTPYEKWAKDMPWFTQYVIEAAEAAEAQLIFPGNNYNYGASTQPISEITPFQPNNDLGRARVRLEKQMKEASQLKRIQTLVVRLPEVWGPNVCNQSFEPVFAAALRGKAIPWLFNIDVAQQMIYNMDAGKAIVSLALKERHKAYEVVNVGGQLFSSMRDFFQKLSDNLQKPLKTKVMTGKTVALLARFHSGLKQVKTLAYKYNKTIMLDDALFQAKLPDFEYTDSETAMEETLRWFHNHRLRPQSAQKKRRKKRAWLDFVSDNLSIGLFPILIGFITSKVPALQSMAVLFGVVAGIYWSPLVRKVFRKFSPLRKSTTVALILLMFGLNIDLKAQEQTKYFDGFYGNVEMGKQNIFSGALIDGVDVLSNRQELITSVGIGYRKALFKQRVVLGTELKLGMLNTDRTTLYHNGLESLSIHYSGDSQWSMGFQLGTVLGAKKQTMLYLFAIDTNRSFDIEFSESNGTVHRQRDENQFTRYGLGMETRLYQQLFLNSKLGGISVSFDNENRSAPLNQKMEFSLGFSYHF